MFTPTRLRTVVESRWAGLLFVLLVCGVSLVPLGGSASAGSLPTASSVSKESWHTIAPIDSDNPGANGALSCVTSTFCMAAQGNLVRSFNGHSWSKDVTLGSGLTSGVNQVSCPTTTFCVAVDIGGYVYYYRGHSWSEGPQIDPVGGTVNQEFGIIDVSCPTTTFCAAIDDGGDAYTYEKGEWSGPQLIAQGQLMESVSCGSAKYCLVTTEAGFSFLFNGHSWTTFGVVAELQGMGEATCASATFCLVTAGNDVYRLDGQSWSAGHDLPSGPGNPGIVGLQCPSTTFCMAFTQMRAYAYALGRWIRVSGGGNEVFSCTATAFCIATDDGYASKFS